MAKHRTQYWQRTSGGQKLRRMQVSAPLVDAGVRKKKPGEMQLRSKSQRQDHHCHQYRQKLFRLTAPAAHHSQAQTQKTREKREVFQVGKHANFRRHPADQDDICVESHGTDDEKPGLAGGKTGHSNDSSVELKSLSKR